ncbi:hypothetical protein Q5M87_05060 [Brachyspira innocens]|uniref:Lipoprotein n=1 Tax=Brachyspira innocens TaxID=13264 RepID=A0ABT8Z0V1_9SPIR|nr:hypothetical protein [Brachyspira innocens]MDO6993375.1 hypothetical protein [Brachyspira innocens]MDO7021019.1 hypothetical protein [Brachyspira innocens]
MKIKKSYLLIIIFALIISCSNPSTNPDNNNNQNTSSSIKAVTSGVHTIQYGRQTSEIDVTDEAQLKTLWITLVSGKTVYKSSDYSSVSGKFDAEGNYYDSTDTVNIRTKIIKCAVYEYNNKKYLAAVYWDNKNTGMPSSYRLIIADEKGIEQAWYGGGSDESVIPNANTQWTKYDFVFGYLKEY